MDSATVTRYCVPLREGGSLPGLVEADDLGMYVCKFFRAGQGPRVLVTEVIVSGIARLLGLDTPRLVQLDLPAELARFEADEEVQDLLRSSVGSNLGVDFLPGSFGFEPRHEVPDETATRVLWLDAFTTNVDRTWRNPNLLWWHRKLWLIDHGAALYAHHGWSRGVGSPEDFARVPWSATDHVFADRAEGLASVHEAARDLLTEDALASVVADVPDVWLEPVPGLPSPSDQRDLYVRMLSARLVSDVWLPGGAS